MDGCTDGEGKPGCKGKWPLQGREEAVCDQFNCNFSESIAFLNSLFQISKV